MDFWDIFLGVLFLIICSLLIIIVLLQKGKGGGLGAAFGGMGQAAFGTKTGDVFTWVTIVLTGLFLILAVAASLSFRPTPGQVSPPDFMPPPGPMAEPTPVTLIPRTDGSMIRFTTDGTDPDDKSADYNKPIMVKPPMTIKARAFRESWTPSRVAVGKYTVAEPNTPTQPARGLPIPASKPAPKPTPAPAPTTAPKATPAPAPVPAAAPKPAPATTKPAEATGPKPAAAPAPAPAPAAKPAATPASAAAPK
jgi:protein translocase SecG subunit